MDIERTFNYHPPTEIQMDRYASIRRRAKALALFIVESCPDSREKSTALTHLQSAVMWANASIAVNEKDADEEAATYGLPGGHGKL